MFILNYDILSPNEYIRNDYIYPNEYIFLTNNYIDYVDYNSPYIYNNIKNEELENIYDTLINNKWLFIASLFYIGFFFLVILIVNIRLIKINNYPGIIFTLLKFILMLRYL